MASSSVVRPTPKGPQMFICFHGPDVRSNFISFLNHALRKANIKVFIDEDELLSNDVKNLLTRIEESEIALVVFTEAFTTSYWCLDQLAKIEERRNQGRLKVIPIFYKVQRSDVGDLRSTFGDNFRDLRRSYLHQPKRIEKWEEAFKKIPELIGMPLLEQSERTDNDFITKLVSRIQELLEQMALEEKQETDVQYMASYSSGVAKISKGPQVFINFQGKVLHNSFIVNLAAALKDANISYSIGKEEVQNMLVRIEESRVALMIFTKEYTNSVRCLNELVKIKECIDKGTLTGIHIYYELKTSIAKNLEGDFGNNFVKTKQYYQQQDLESTLKWEKALKSLTGIKGLTISETSEKSERELIIESIVDKVKSSLYDFDQKQKKSEITHSDNPKHRTGSSTEEPLKNSSLATIPRPVRPVPHRVFINYCNEPSHTFIKHLLSQLEESKINYFIFENLKKGTPYSQRLKIIEESVIALVIFSKRYTQSTRCLDELVKIEERVKNRKLKVFTVYVNVTQTEAMVFGKEFEAMTERLKIESEKVKKWKDAVRYFADIASLGWNEGNRSINNKHPNDITDKDLACRVAQTVKMELLENYPFIRLSGEKSREKSREKSGKTEKFIYYFLKSGISALVFSCLLSKLVLADWNLSFILALLISLWHFFEA